MKPLLKVTPVPIQVTLGDLVEKKPSHSSSNIAKQGHNVNKKRPVNLDLRTIRFPLPAITSILHRISGFLLFLLIPVLLWALSASLSSADSFAALKECFSYPIAKFCVWVILSALAYHLVAGIRHLLMDCGWGESLTGGRMGAKLILIVSAILIIAVGVWLW